MLTDAECDAIIEATFNGLEGIEVHMLGGDGWSDRALIRAGWQARAGYAAPPREPVAWHLPMLGTHAHIVWGKNRPDYPISAGWAPLYAAPSPPGPSDEANHGAQTVAQHDR